MLTTELPFAVGHDLLFLHPRMAGVRVYATNLLTALLEDPVARNFRHTVYVSRDGAACLGPLPAGVTLRVLPVDGVNKLAKLWWQQTRLPRLAAEDAIDVLHCYDYVVPLWSRVSTVMTIHDLRYLDRTTRMGRSARMVRTIFIPAGIVRSSAVAAVSDFTMDAIRARFALGDRPTATIPDAAEPLTNEQPDPGLPARLGVAGPYVLCVGTVSSHKNYGAVIEAMATLSRPDVSLVIAGRESRHSGELAALASARGIRDRVVFTGFADRATLASLYRGARVFVMASHFEGFGIPVLEAMQFGVPVACSGAGALREVASDAARYFDPTSVLEIAASVRELLDDEETRREMIERGAGRVAHFTWSRSAETMRELLLAVRARNSAAVARDTTRSGPRE